MCSSDLLPDERTVSIVASILALAHSLKATVVAQGVETHEQQAVLQALGCPFGQGYFFSEPLGLDEWRALLDADAALLAQPPASGTVALARADAAAIPR